MASKSIQAAGGIVVRNKARPLVAVVQRAKDGAWVLPRGKLKRDERPVAGAQREVVEETGHRVAVNEFLGAVTYRAAGKAKVVLYWQMQAEDEASHALMADIVAVEWLTLKAAMRRLSYPLEKLFLRNVGRRALARVRTRKVPSALAVKTIAKKIDKKADKKVGKKSGKKADKQDAKAESKRASKKDTRAKTPKKIEKKLGKKADKKTGKKPGKKTGKKAGKKTGKKAGKSAGKKSDKKAGGKAGGRSPKPAKHAPPRPRQPAPRAAAGRSAGPRISELVKAVPARQVPSRAAASPSDDGRTILQRMLGRLAG